MKMARVHVGVWVGVSVVAVGLIGCTGQEPQVTDLPAVYRSVGEIAWRGMCCAASEPHSFRIEYGDH